MLKSVHVWANGTVSSFNARGEPIQSLSGNLTKSLKERLRRNSTPETTWATVRYGHVVKTSLEEVLG